MAMWKGWAVIALAGTVVALPAQAEDIVRLRRGYYVRADIPCERASNVTTILFTGKSFGTRCTVEQIETAGKDVRVSQTCRSRGYVTRSSQLYRVVSDREFTLSVGDQDIPHRLCAQADMPLPWAATDLSDMLRCGDTG